MRILQVPDFYPPVLGGMERQVQTLSHELARRGHRVAVATTAHPEAPEYERDGDVQVYRLKGWQRILAPFYQSGERPFHPTVPDPGLAAALWRVIQAERPEIINSYGWITYSLLPIIRRSGARLVVSLLDYGLVCAKRTMTYGDLACEGAAIGKCLRCASAHYGAMKGVALTGGLFASAGLYGRADRYIAVSSAVARACTPGTGQAEGRTAIVPTFIPDGVAAEALTVPRPEFLPSDDGYLLFVGVLSAHKGIHILLDAYRGLRNPPPLVVIGTPFGDPPSTYPPGVIVARNVQHAQVMAAWAGCSVGIVPSVWPDPCPQVTMEAMAMGKPVVASATGGLTDLVQDGESGLLVRPGDAASLRDAVQRLIDDPGLRARMGEAGRARAGRYMASTVVTEIERIYAEVCGVARAEPKGDGRYRY